MTKEYVITVTDPYINASLLTDWIRAVAPSIVSMVANADVASFIARCLISGESWRPDDTLINLSADITPAGVKIIETE